MLSGLFKNSSFGAKLVISIFVILISMLLFTILGILISIPVFGLNLTSLMDSMGTPDSSNIAFMKLFQSAISLGMFVVPPFIIAWLLKGEVTSFLFINNKPYPFSILLVAVIMVLAIPFINFLAEWNAKLSLPGFLAGLEQFMKNAEQEAEKLTMLFLKAEGIGTLTVNLIVIAIIPAVGEELLFRGVFQKLFTDWTKNAHIGIWVAAFLFSAIHFQFYGFLPRMIMGAFFGYLLFWSKNMWLPIAAHFANNAFAVITYYLMNKSVIGDSAETMGTGNGSFTTALVSFVLVASLTYILIRYQKEKDAGQVQVFAEESQNNNQLPS